MHFFIFFFLNGVAQNYRKLPLQRITFFFDFKLFLATYLCISFSFQLKLEKSLQANCFEKQPQRNKDTEWNKQPLSSPILFQNEIQKLGKSLKKLEKHNFYLLGHPESLKIWYFITKCVFSIFFKVLDFLEIVWKVFCILPIFLLQDRENHKR